MSYNNRSPRNSGQRQQQQSGNRDWGDRGSFGDQNNSGSGNGSSGRRRSNNGNGGRGYGGGGGNQQHKFTRLGSVSIPKNAANNPDIQDAIALLIDSGAILNVKFFFGRDDDAQFNLRNHDRAMVSFRPGDKDPDWVVANLIMSNEG